MGVYAMRAELGEAMTNAQHLACASECVCGGGGEGARCNSYKI